MTSIRFLPAFICLAAPAAAQDMNVVTDIPPVASLAQLVLDEAPAVLIPGNADPHHFALRPSDVERLSEADLIVTVGPELMPQVAESIASLGAGAAQLVLLETQGWDQLQVDGHLDPHAWLDPAIASLWAGEIGLAMTDLEGIASEARRDRTLAALATLDELGREVETLLAQQSRPIIWPHEGYGYFERRFGLESLGTIAAHDAEAPGPVRIGALQERAREQPVCILSDASVSMDLAAVVGEGADARFASIDPIGTVEDGYAAMIRTLATAIADCTAP